MSSQPFLYPNVSRVTPQTVEGEYSKVQDKKKIGELSDFDKVLGETIKSPLKFSAHASQRMTERKIQLDAGMMSRVNEALDRADKKGVEDTLVLAGDAALIINVKNRTVITAMDKNSLQGNIFTNIDGAVIV